MPASTPDSSVPDIETGAAAGVASVPLVETHLDRWKRFVAEQERLCTEHGFRAAMVTIGVDRADDLARATEQVQAALRSTDRAGVLCDTEIAVLLMPLESIHHAQRLVHVLDGALRAAGLPSHVGWAMRLDGHGLFHAAARADAAMVSARAHGRRAATDRTDRTDVAGG